MSENAKPSSPISMHRQVSLEFLKNSEAFAVRAPRGQKDPGKGWDPKLNDRAKSDVILYELQQTDENVGAHFHGALVDVDVDVKKVDARPLLQALDAFLPPCSHVWGRGDRKRTHRAYVLQGLDAYEPARYPFLKRLQKIDEANVEIRGGPASRGEYSLLPGSIHPEGDEYQWADLGRARSTPSITGIDTLIRGVRQAGAVSVLVPYWTEGSRNDMIMMLSGFLHKAYTIAQSIGEDVFSLDRDQAEHFVTTLLDIAGDERSDRYSRMKTFKATWDKADAGQPVLGGKALAELTNDPTILNKLYTLLTDSPDVALLDEFVSRFAIWQGPGVVIDMDQAAKGAQKPIMTRQAFSNSYGHKFIMIEDKKKLISELMFTMPSTQRVNGLTFEPGKELFVEDIEGRKINQWGGFAIPPWKDPVEDKEIKPFLSYVEDVIASHDPDLYNWVMGWLSNLFAEPHKRTGTALVLVGLPGAGKSILGHSVIMPIIGDQHSAATNSVESITRGFNIQFDNKIFVQCDEATNNKQKGTANKLKSVITDPKMMVEPKGVDPFFKPNHIRLMFTSNDVEDAINITDGTDDRRYTVVKVSDHRVGQMDAYWLPFVKWLQDVNNLSKIHRYLIDRPYDRAFISRPVRTEAKDLMQQRSWSTFDSWLAQMVAREHPLSEFAQEAWYDAPMVDHKTDKIIRDHFNRKRWPDLISYEALAKDYTYFCRVSGARNADHLNSVQIGQSLQRRGIRPKEDVRIRCKVTHMDDRKNAKIEKYIGLYRTPALKVISEFLRIKYGFSPDDVREIVEDDKASNETSTETEF